jgi:hypothetical protein
VTAWSVTVDLRLQPAIIGDVRLGGGANRRCRTAGERVTEMESSVNQRDGTAFNAGYRPHEAIDTVNPQLPRPRRLAAARNR